MITSFVFVLGTAFFPLQSCINHSCCPNAKAFKREEVNILLHLRVLFMVYTFYESPTLSLGWTRFLRVDLFLVILQDRDGQAVIIASRRINKNEEVFIFSSLFHCNSMLLHVIKDGFSIWKQVTISYIDEELPYKERQALLADYGFICNCPKCLQDSSLA